MHLAATSCFQPKPGVGSLEHLIWPTSEFSLFKLEHNTASERSSMISRYLDSQSKEVTLPHSQIKVEF